MNKRHKQYNMGGNKTYTEQNTAAKSILRLLLSVVYLFSLIILVTLLLPDPTHPATVLIFLIGLPVAGHAFVKGYLSRMGYSIIAVSFVVMILTITMGLSAAFDVNILSISQSAMISITTGTLMGTFILSYYILIRSATIANKIDGREGSDADEGSDDNDNKAG